MNALSPIKTRTEPTRMKFTLADVDAMVRAGIMPENARVELIDGDLIQMASEDGPHIRYKSEIVRWLNRHLPDDVRVAPDATLRLSDEDAPEPDAYVYPAVMNEEDVRGRDTSLVIEVAQTTQSFDLRKKATLYAQFEVPEYWVVDVPNRVVHVHTEPALAGYAVCERRDFSDDLRPRAFTDLKLRLDAIERLTPRPPA